MKSVRTSLFVIAIASLMNVAGAKPNDQPKPAKVRHQEIILDAPCRNPNVSVQPLTACFPTPQTPPKKVPNDSPDAGQK